ncbi:PEP/pyruvate-binding domain-containing protein [Pseudotamlana agarivorans]|uniref:PEP/pyruvate-binding domain-containing protein n=1 Tax=Pseudotamlana agarivorans TaxID=481183 RepID=UPI000A031AEA|nr:PEP/pyruvate-binding domain-containing protein [Tamlana agarivorans]
MKLPTFQKFTTKLMVLGCLGLSSPVTAQDLPIEKIKSQIEAYKKDVRGPYHRIKWYCDDGTMREPKDPCPDNIGGIQHASLKTDVEKLGNDHHIYFSNILAQNENEAFWDEAHNNSRLKQYQLVKFLQNADDGWIYRRGQFYRGAMQSEDEQNWGLEFYEWLLKSNQRTNGHFFLLKQSLTDIPHSGDTNLAQKMRSESKVLGNEVPSFMKLRIKIHGNPEKRDIASVKDYVSKHSSTLSENEKKEFNTLINTMEDYYKPLDIKDIKNLTNKLSSTHKSKITELLNAYSENASAKEQISALGSVLMYIRKHFDALSSAKDKLYALDISNKIEKTVFQTSQEWQPSHLRDMLEKIDYLSYIAAATGLIELWEYDKANHDLTLYKDKNHLTIAELNDVLGTSRSIVEWSAGMVKAVYSETVETYSQFEPKAYGFIDDRIRSSIALDLGNSVAILGKYISEKSSIKNEVIGVSKPATIRGLNPGYAYGELVVVEGSIENIDFSKDKIYVFNRPPSGLKPVAGIMTVSEGNLVSHVQLLARNLGVPNAALSQGNLDDLAKYNGKKVFYAVSTKGNVILKTEKQMTSEEKALFSKVERSTNKITVPVDRIQLDQTDILNMREVDASDSGKLCGPKAANLSQLKHMFPDHVVEGFVIPFGIFRKHLDNPMKGQNMTYWEYLKQTYQECENMKKANKTENEVEAYQFSRLSVLRTAIINMDLNRDFIAQLREHFKKAFNKPIGETPVFLRSDTNMEDLKEFTGAGLNLTLFNVLTEKNIIDGIKQVWASPYMERSLKWRQKYLLNPEYVFPSILVIPGVNVDYSGVVVTTGINAGGKDDLTIAFSKGAGGAVDGQSAETRMVASHSNQLLSPSREPSFLSLPKTGGTKREYTTFEAPILSEKNMQSVRDMVAQVRKKMPEQTGSDYRGPYDMEMGFKDDKLWLFQIRPFVENKKASSSEYLKSITPKIDYKQHVDLNSKI